jgi:preprotein translocase subunit SecE
LWRAAGRSRAAIVLRRGVLEAPASETTPGKRMVNPFQFLQEVRSEANKVTWPTRRETMITTGLVILMVLFASLFFVVVDSALRFLVGLMLRAGQ